MMPLHTALALLVTGLLTLCRTQDTDGDIRLHRGTETSSGIVQIYANGSWTSLCGLTFTDAAAEVTCRQLQFSRGVALPLGAFGEYNEMVPYTRQFQKCPTGQESRLLECVFDDVAKCTPHRLAYASVNCMDEPTADPGSKVKLDSDKSFAEVGYFTPVSVYGREMWGHICGQFWDDDDARVVCRQLGYYGGLATYSSADWTIPVLLTEINCIGNETDLSLCAQSDSFCYDDKTAAVVCYQSDNLVPTISLVGGKEHYGQVVFSVDGRRGLICNRRNHDSNAGPWTYREAAVVCRQLGYTGGYVLEEKYDTGDVTDVLLDDVTCSTGDEESLLHCLDGDWGDVTAGCTNTNTAVYCYSDVRLAGSGVTETEELYIGRVELYDVDTWYGVCADTFTLEAATVTCRQFGFPVSEILLPETFSGSLNLIFEGVSHVSCNGSEDRLTSCNYTVGSCQSHVYHAALLCKHAPTPDVTTFSLSDTYFGVVYAERFGIRGHLCREGWDENDATVICRQTGWHSGIVLGTRRLYSRDQPVWVSQFSCDGSEATLANCAYNTSLSTDWPCADDLSPAGVLCFRNAPPDILVRLADGVTNDHGRVEVYNDISGWGTVCNSGWGNTDAAVFCRQAGFADGQVHPAAYRSLATDLDVVLSGVSCDGSETSIFDCGNYGWLTVSRSCTYHDRDAGVYCYRHVQLYPSPVYGAVQYHTGEKYGLVCADGFDANAATVVCQEMGDYYGLPMCCSAFGPLSQDFSLSNVNCDGSERTLRDCSYIEDNPMCASGLYAGVVCFYSPPISSTRVGADPIVMVSYGGHEGFVCSDGFTDADARVICSINGFSHGKAFKATEPDMEHKIRWLRDLGCSGTESSIQECGVLQWGQIGVCSWDSVAAVICSDNLEDMDFEIRLANGSSEVSGRVEVKVNGIWGTICGIDFTRTEANVACKQLNYHAGINMAAGHFGPGTGDVTLTAVECSGNESSVTDCIWSGYDDNMGSVRQLCGHSLDAALTCFYNTRLAGSTTINYGRLEMYDSYADTWLAVCDRNLNVNHATIICRQMGYAAGMFQRGSPLGPTSTEISIVTVDCTDISECTIETGSCSSDKYVALYCSVSTITNENVEVRLPLSSFYGPVSIRRFGLWGHVCSGDFDDNDAIVVCSQLGYGSGAAVETYATSGYPIIQGSVKCAGTEAAMEACPRGLFADEIGCYAIVTDTSAVTVAGVIFYNAPGLDFGSADLDHDSGRMSTGVEIKVNHNSLYASQVKFTDIDAAVYCTMLGYAGGEVYHAGFGSYGVTELSCTGAEETILDCPGIWDPEKTSGKTGNLAGVTCYTAVRLVQGDPEYYGVVFTSKGVNSGPICAQGFDAIDAGVACSSLDFDAGLVLCCAPFGDINQEPVLTNMQCTGSEKQFTDCAHDDAGSELCPRDYAAVACYSGTKPTEYSTSLASTDSSSYAGNLALTYMGINGSICMDGWGDVDAHVACRELGYQTGVAYNAARSVPGPFWTTEVTCLGTESKLAECQMTPFGEVTTCSTILSHAGVICYDNEGIYSRLFGTNESRYGRAELSVGGEWRSICNTHWDNEDAHVLCRMLDFRTGDAFQGTYNDTLSGPVWDINFMCDGSEGSLTQCVSSGWRASTSEACARHEHDAGAFCYTSVKLSTGVGRETDQGGVLLYKDDMWYSVCADGFTSESAKVVCKELGFKDGETKCCSQYGSLENFPRLQTHKVTCNGDETEVSDCLVEDTCNSADYASVVCYGFTIGPTEPVTQAPGDKEFDALPIIIAVVLFLCLMLIFIGVVYVLKKHRARRKEEAAKETFDNAVYREEVDGSISIVNRLHGVMGTPEVPRVTYETRGGEQSANIGREQIASTSYSYGNPNYSTISDGNLGDSVIPASTFIHPGQQSKTVIDIRTSTPYDNLDRSEIGEPHLYDSIRTIDMQESASDNRNNSDIGQGDGYSNLLANQDELASPTYDNPEPHFPQIEDTTQN